MISWMLEIDDLVRCSILLSLKKLRHSRIQIGHEPLNTDSTENWCRLKGFEPNVPHQTIMDSTTELNRPKTSNNYSNICRCGSAPNSN